MSIFFNVGSIAIITYSLPIGCRLKLLIIGVAAGIIYWIK
jgi:hypothetical protein